MVEVEKDMEIVLIEDDEDDAERMLRFLRSNFTNSVRHIQDGAAAAEFLLFATDTVPKLILLDLVLPYLDGLEIFQMIRNEPKKRKLSVILLVPTEETKNYLESIGIHPDGFLRKATQHQLPLRFE